MRLITVTEQEGSQRLDKLLARYLKEAPKSFLYKMLRKKNITLNGKKADGSEKLQPGDQIRIFLSEETYEKFSGAAKKLPVKTYPQARLDIVYEDEHILLVNKPAGMLTQKSRPTDLSLNEYLLGYLQRTGAWTGREEMRFRPSVCNRLDRNTSGLVVCGKSLAGLQQMAELLQDRSLHKYYQCVVAGRMTEARRIEGWLWKDEAANRVEILDAPREGAHQIVTEYRPLKVGEELTLLEVLLVTGRSHQIRAHLSFLGHPILGDTKYGDPGINETYRRLLGVQAQQLHACRLELPHMKPPLEYLSGRVFQAEPPALMKKLLEGKR